MKRWMKRTVGASDSKEEKKREMKNTGDQISIVPPLRPRS